MFDELMASRTCLPELFTTSQRPVYKPPRRIASKFAGCCLRLYLVGTPQGPAHEGRGRGLGLGVRSHRVSDVKARSAGRTPQAAPPATWPSRSRSNDRGRLVPRSGGAAGAPGGVACGAGSLRASDVKGRQARPEPQAECEKPGEERDRRMTGTRCAARRAPRTPGS